jgi:hypothetical protein
MHAEETDKLEKLQRQHYRNSAAPFSTTTQQPKSQSSTKPPPVINSNLLHTTESSHSRSGVTRKQSEQVGPVVRSPKSYTRQLSNNDKGSVGPSSARSGSISYAAIPEPEELTGKKWTRIRIKTCHRTYVCALVDKTVVEHSVNKLEEEYIWNKFDLPEGGISLKSCYSRFLSAEKGGKLVTNRSRKQNERFTIETIPNAKEKVAIKTCFGEFLCALPDGSLQANRFGPQPWETFEIEEEPFAPPVFGGNLNDIVVYQLKNGLYSQVPHVLEVLAELITKFDGHRTEGIWRISGDGVAVMLHRSEMQKGNYDCKIDTCHDAATLFKLFLRELTEPVFPEQYYSTSLRFAEEQNITAVQAMVKQFDNINVKVIQFVINFLRSFLKPEFVKLTMMPANNLATVFAPTLLRCPSDNPLMQITVASSEVKFVLMLLENFPDDLKEDYFKKT